MSIRSTNMMIATSDLSTVYPTDHFTNEEIPSGNVFVGARDMTSFIHHADHWRKKHGVVRRRVTHVSQKVEKDQGVMDDWVNMVNATINAHTIPPNCEHGQDELLLQSVEENWHAVGLHWCQRGAYM
jgi:hypothetical protein